MPSSAGRTRRLLGVVVMICAALLLPLVLVALNVAAMTTQTWVNSEYGARDFPQSALFDDEARKGHAKIVLEYLNGYSTESELRDRRIVPEGARVFSQPEADHLVDVRKVMAGLRWAGVLAAVALALLIFGVLRSGGRRSLGNLLIAAPAAAAGLGAIAALWALLDFDRFFLHFHRTFFAEGTFSFFADSSIIQLFPQRLWMDAAGALALGTIIEGLVIVAMGVYLRRTGVRT